MSEKLETVGWVECDTHQELGFLGLVLHHHYVEGGWPVVRQDQHESILSERDATIAQQAAEIERMEREAFEKFVVAPPFEYSTERMTELSAWPGNYRSIAVQLAWESWKARGASSEQSERG